MDEFLCNCRELEAPDQLGFLYSDLGVLRQDNPEGFHRAQTAWSSIILNACQQRLLGPSMLCLDPATISAQLTYRGNHPTGIHLVIQQMQAKGDLQPLSQFMATTYLNQLLGWVSHQFTSGSCLLVSPALVHQQAQQILQLQLRSDQTDRLMSIDQFRHLLAPPLCLRDAQILIKYLSDHRHAALAEAEAEEVIKFAPTAPAKNHQPLAVTEADLGVYRISATHRQLIQQIDQLQTRLRQLDQQIRQALINKQHQMAKTTLRHKKYIESNVLQKRIDAQENIEKLLWQLEQSSNDLQVIKALQVGTRVLSGMNREAEEMDVGEVVAEWAEETAKAEEVEKVLKGEMRGLETSSVDDDEELEKELEALVNNEQQAEQLAEALDKVGISSASKPEEPKEPKEPEEPERELVPAS